MFFKKKSQTSSSPTSSLDKRVRKLMRLDPTQRIVTIQQELAELAQSGSYDLKRLEFYEACRLVLMDSVATMRDGQIGLKVPLSDREFTYIKGLVSLLFNLAQQYEELANIVSEGGPAASGDDNREAYCVHRQLELLESVVSVSAQAYYPIPPGLWINAHAAAERGIRLKALDFSGRENEDSKSIGDLYAVLILLGLADPHQLGFRELAGVRNFILDSASRVVIRSAKSFSGQDEQRYLFAVDYSLDTPALPWRMLQSGKTESIDLVLDVTRVVTRARKRQLALKSTPGGKDTLLGEMPSDAISTLYKHFIVEWGKQPIRRAARKSEQVEYDVVLGFEAACLAPTVDFTEYSDDKAAIMAGLYSRQTAEDKATLEDIGAYSSKSLDISSTGIRLQITGKSIDRVRTGELISFHRADSSDSWIVGVIRWLKSASSTQCEVGVLVLGEIECAGKLREFGMEEETSVRKVLVLDRSRYKSSERWLVSPNLIPNTTQPLRLVMDSESVTLESVRLALHTRHMTCHRIEVQLSPGMDGGLLTRRGVFVE